MRTRAPITIQSQIREELVPLLAAGELLDSAVVAGATALSVADGSAVADTPGLGTEMLTLGLGGVILAVRLGIEMVALRVGEKLAIGPPPLCPQAATKHPARTIAAASSKLSVKRRIWIPPH
jgi:hypothetical protein